MRQLCNLIYSDLATGLDRIKKADLDAKLAPPDEKQQHVDRMNREAMQRLQGMGMPPPPRKPRAS